MQVYEIILDKSNKETTKHGTYEFPLAIYTTQISKNILGAIPWHWHEELQFCVVTEGVVEIQINNETVILSKGDGIFINVGQMHQANNHQGIEGAYICIDFHPNLISGFPGSVLFSKYVAPYIDAQSASYYIFESKKTDWHRSIIAKLMEIESTYQQGGGDFELQIQILLLQIWKDLVMLAFSSEVQSQTKSWDPRIKKMIEFINLHYSEPFRLDDLAEYVSLSKGACCRAFKKHVNRTISEYLLDYRLIASTRMLLTTNESITNIAYTCGFGSTSYFIEKFKQKSGLSPLVYRKEKIK